MRIVVSGGGTTGHVSPVLATVDALQDLAKGLDVVYIGQPRGVEADLARAAGLRFIGVAGGKLRRLPGAGLRGNLARPGDLLRNLRDLVLIAVGVVQCVWIMGRQRPAVVFNKVGPTGLSVGLAAAILRIPMVLHEPDVIAGLGNRLLSRFAVTVATGFPVAEQRGLPHSKLVHTGTPVQPAMLKGSRSAGRSAFGFTMTRPLVLVVGGSQGAQGLNTAVSELLPGLLKTTQLHIVSGRYDHDRLMEILVEHGLDNDSRLRIDSYLEVPEMAKAYAAADIVVARAGASTLTELAAWHKAVIVVPNRRAAAHQVANATAFEQAGAVLVATEDAASLGHAISELLTSPQHQHRLEEAIAPFYRPDAATRIAELLLKAGGAR